MLHSLSRTHIALHHWFLMTSHPRLGSLGPIYWMICKFLCFWCSLLRAGSCSAGSKTMFCRLRYLPTSKSCSWTWWLDRHSWRLSLLCDRLCFLLLFASLISVALPLHFSRLSLLLVLWRPTPYLFFFIPPAPRSSSARLTLFKASKSLPPFSFKQPPESQSSLFLVVLVWLSPKASFVRLFQLISVRVTSPKPARIICVSTPHQQVSFPLLLFAFAPFKFLLVSSVLSLLFSVLLFLQQSSLNVLFPPSLAPMQV